MILRQPTLEECELVRQWRNAPDVLPTLRTREPLTVEQQATFYRDVVCNPASNHRYYALEAVRLGYAEWNGEFKPTRTPTFVGLGGLTYFDRTPGEAEISLILSPAYRKAGLGAMAVRALRVEGGRVGLRWIVGECFNVNPAQTFWAREVAKCDGSVRYESDRMFFRMAVLEDECHARS